GRLAQAVDDEWPEVQATLERIRALLLNRTALIANVTADAEGWRQFRPELASFLSGLPDGPLALAAWEPNLGRGGEGLTIPAQVNYVGKGADLYRLGYQLHGSALVINRYLRTTWLWDQIREQGGAYGGFSILDPRSGAFTFVSYRDPNLLRTLDVYARTPEYQRRLERSESGLTRAISGAISALDACQLPDARGFTSLVRYLTGDDDEYRQRVRDEVLGTSLDDFRRFAEVLERVRDAGLVVVMG